MNTREVTRRDVAGGIVAVEVYDDTGALLATRTPRRDSKGNLTGWTTTQTEAGQLAHEREARKATAGPIRKLRNEFSSMLTKAVGAARREGRRVGYDQGFADGEAAQRKRDKALIRAGAAEMSRAILGYAVDLELPDDDEDDPEGVTLEDRPERTRYRSDDLRPRPEVSVRFEDGGRAIYRQEREP